MTYLNIKPLNEISKDILSNKLIKGRLLRFIVLGDSHVIYNTDSYLEKNAFLYNKILMKINDRIESSYFKPDFIIHGGDVVNNGNDELSFKLFYKLTYDELIHKGIPVFVSIGNHNYDILKTESNTKNFHKFIGNTRGDICIPGTKVRYIYLNTHYCFESIDSKPIIYSYFSQKKNEDIDLLKKMNPNNIYLIDFHNTFRMKGINDSLPQTDYHYLQEIQKNLFRNSVNPNAKIGAIFSHHMHTMMQCKFNVNSCNKDVPFLISGKGGNCNINNSYGSYYEIILDMITNSIKCNQIIIS
ncbi:metallophosphoesterase family protein [Clostridium psychrophilum]|uniref:metallophosphoesterase family protein n=1 Tax=Clostridium psychrophilum TaxID=132926 RepID=UPI001C0C088E|nr:metallophosphoesterase [Clostridium psychrophilum]MBU3181388.1 metallophosphoesterase [Clostridium psychrophilum]